MSEDLINEDIYLYTTDSGKQIAVQIIRDCGMIPNRRGELWHKVLCFPLGYNNIAAMAVDFTKLTKEAT